MNQPSRKLYSFLKAVRGNWRNAFYIACPDCPYGQKDTCHGFLFTADAQGIPLFMSVEELKHLTGESIEPEECRACIGRQAFESVYALYLEWHTVSDQACPVIQINEM